jgi:MoaA/NifB/PqqE/SkfB family radical SAM enzyme
MFDKADYINRGFNFLNNHLFPAHKRISSLMIYATDLCDSACKHCLIWAKRPPKYLSFEMIKKIMESKCISEKTNVGLEGGEFLLHPEADEILNWFSHNHPNFDIFSNCLKPERLITAVEKYKPKRLYISLDGTEDTYRYMRGKDGYNNVLKVVESLKDKVPVFVMFTLSPYNDFDDLEHVAELCNFHKVFLRVGIYNNIPFFDTIDNAKSSRFGQLKNKELLSFKKAKQLQEGLSNEQTEVLELKENVTSNRREQIPLIIKEFQENYDYVQLYDNWTKGHLRLKCHSIMDSVVILPDGSVPVCQNLDVKLGNVYNDNLDHIFNSGESVKTQKHYSENCNQCWISYHRKYDIILYRTFEKYFGRWATSKMLGYYKWSDDDSTKYKDAIK